MGGMLYYYFSKTNVIKFSIAVPLTRRQSCAKGDTKSMEIIARRPKPSVQDVYETDTNRAPDILRMESPPERQSLEDVSAERYFSPEWHAREVEYVWRKCWQLACRVEDIPKVGDQLVYDIPG